MLLNQPVLLIVGVIVFGWLLVLSVLTFKNFAFDRKLTRGLSKKDLKTVLEKLLKDLGQESARVKKLIEEIEKVKRDKFYNLQKIGLVRYNPFAETGGNQSFCLAVLDGNNSGLVISSLHSRDTTRVYAKPVKNGKTAGYDLSDEEKMAIKKAKRIK